MVAVRNPALPEDGFWLYRSWPVNLLMNVSCFQQVEMVNIMLYALLYCARFQASTMV
jgi:hypothetical protein